MIRDSLEKLILKLLFVWKVKKFPASDQTRGRKDAKLDFSTNYKCFMCGWYDKGYGIEQIPIS